MPVFENNRQLMLKMKAWQIDIYTPHIYDYVQREFPKQGNNFNFKKIAASLKSLKTDGFNS